MAKEASDRGVPVFPILVGKEGETLAPVRDSQERLADVRPIRDNVNPQLLKDIADTTKVASTEPPLKTSSSKICMRFLTRLKK